jgi:hypothetical protein
MNAYSKPAHDWLSTGTSVVDLGYSTCRGRAVVYIWAPGVGLHYVSALNQVGFFFEALSAK